MQEVVAGRAVFPDGRQSASCPNSQRVGGASTLQLPASWGMKLGDEDIAAVARGV